MFAVHSEALPHANAFHIGEVGYGIHSFEVHSAREAASLAPQFVDGKAGEGSGDEPADDLVHLNAYFLIKGDGDRKGR
jgi:hypothetical protein